MVAKDAKIQQNLAPTHQLWFGFDSIGLHQVCIIKAKLEKGFFRFAQLVVCQRFYPPPPNLVCYNDDADDDDDDNGDKEN